MKLILLSLCLLLSEFIFAQDNSFVEALNKIIGDAKNDFRNIRGNIKTTTANDSTFQCQINLGLHEEEIYFAGNQVVGTDTIFIHQYGYHATIDSVTNEKDAKKIVQKWTKQISRSIGTGWQKKSGPGVSGTILGRKYIQKGNWFEKDGIVISVCYTPGTYAISKNLPLHY